MEKLLELVKNVLLYSDKEPLIFTRLYFWGFFAIVLAIYSIIYKQKTVRNAYLFFVSLFFYYKTSGLFFIILLFSTLIDFFIGKKIYSSRSPIAKKWLVGLSVLINLLVLGYFKYAYFVVDNLNGLLGTHFTPINYFAEFGNMLTGSHFEINKILLPVGISFFTFQTISYSVDVYWGKIKPVTNILDFGFYVSFFPQLVAGPIVRASEFIPQLYQDYKLSKAAFGHALFLILNGLIKKMVIGDYIAVNFIDRVFDNPLSYSGFENLMALYGYSLQVYADFSGYTDIAIGVALLMGFQLPLNFNSPYKAKNVGEFWKRWHISLSTWLKDYLYIPMGGNRGASWFTYISLAFVLSFIILLSGKLFLAYIFGGIILVLYLTARFSPTFKLKINTNINLMMTMLLGGLWHGASWQFVIWGGLNGLGLIIYKMWKKISPFRSMQTRWFVVFIGIFITFNFITFTRIWFRGESILITQNIIHQITQQFSWSIVPQVLFAFKTVFLMMLFGYIIHWLPDSTKAWYRSKFIQTPIWLKGIIVVLVVTLLYQTRTAEVTPFIYFQF
ncbi:MAG: MBOAT family protein [Bacteroidales bacterium]|nr:MBOAT family protein [Bacteroidales bacterium]